MASRMPTRRRRPSGWRPAEVAGVAIAVVGVLVAAVALGLDHPPGGSDGGAATRTAPVTTTPPIPPPPGTTPPTATPTTAIARYLTELAPDSGGGNVVRVGLHSLRMPCGTGESDDTYREVSYVLPAALDARSFAAGVGAAGTRDTRIRATLYLDTKAARSVIIVAGRSTDLRWSGQRPGRLTLRIVCDPGATAATFVDPALSG